MRQNFVGVVVSHGKMAKTAKVRVTRPLWNDKVKKFVSHRKDYLVHDEASLVRTGDVVRIEACRPISARKSFAVAEVRDARGAELISYFDAARAREAERAVTGEASDVGSPDAMPAELIRVGDQTLRPSREFWADYRLFKQQQFLSSAYADATEAWGGKTEADVVAALKAKHGVSEWPPKIVLATTVLREKVAALDAAIARLEAE
ncbi:mitochondrial 37S ribosomal protein uS17m [Dipodascopsis tothii]|uniref:mitochondrial 37S ribosomal protein uS17m n=1 Tax=Dipodascopsis tothii TaxID=44089 RepID=UPI0034CFC61C